MATDRAQLKLGSPSTSDKGAFSAIGVCHIDSGDLWAGAEVNTTTLLKALSRRPELRLSVILLNEGEMSRRLRSYGIDVLVIPESKNGFFSIFNQAARFLHSHPVQILHSHRYKENLLAALLVRRCRIPHLVCTRHGAPEPFRGWRRVKHTAIGYLDQLIARHAVDQVVSLSDELRARLVLDLPERKVVTIRTGIDREQVRSALTQAEAKARLGLSTQVKVVGYAGRLVRIKRLDIFLHAARQMAETDLELAFVIAGTGPEEEQLRALARELNLDGRVHFLGYRARIYDVMRAFDIFVLCSDHEGLPRSLLEALFLGVPVVARSVGGIPEVVRGTTAAVLVGSTAPSELARSCQNLLADENRRRQAARAGIRLVEEGFSVERSAREMIGLYGELDGD